MVVVEDDPWTRLIGVVLDPTTAPERFAAFSDFMSPDEPDFAGWCDGVRKAVGRLFPSTVRLVCSQTELRQNLSAARALVVESLAVGRDELACAPHLKLVHKYGAVMRNIDVAACRAAGVAVHGIRRRANISCAEHAFALMLALARRLHRLNGLISAEQLAAAGFAYRPFDRQHVPGANFGRIPGMRNLSDSTIGIIGLGEIGREIALRAAAFGMRTLYFQRTRLPADEEEALEVSYRSLETLLAHSDWVVPQVPGGRSTRHLLDRERLAMMKPGACLINVSRAEVVERNAVLDALLSGQLGGFALDPLYESPGRSDDELLAFDNVIATPHMAGSPRFNGLKDIEELIKNLAQALCA
ncbi:MAG TPA: NAD(P)-dependent oxidoreductase [Xanthobacteraceae bacterium]|jgi:phosphoglycerate dehydrogenase-like enzyme